MNGIAATQYLALSTPTAVSWLAYIIIGGIAGWAASKIVRGGGSGILLDIVVAAAAHENSGRNAVHEIVAAAERRIGRGAVDILVAVAGYDHTAGRGAGIDVLEAAVAQDRAAREARSPDEWW